MSDENLSGDPNRYVTLSVLATKLAGTNLTASAGVLSASGGGASLSDSTPSAHGIGQSGAAGTATEASRSDHVHAIPVGVPVAVGATNSEGTATTASRSDHVHASSTAGYTRTLIGTSSSMGTTVVTLNLSSTMDDGEIIEILWRASAGGRIYGNSLISADAILDLTAQTTTPTTNSTGIQFKIGDTATGVNIFGQGSGFLWLIDTDSIYLANGRQRAMVAEVYELVPPAGGAGQPSLIGSDTDNVAVAANDMVATTVAVPASGTFVFVAPGGRFGVVRRIVREDIPTIEAGVPGDTGLPCSSRSTLTDVWYVAQNAAGNFTVGASRPGRSTRQTSVRGNRGRELWLWEHLIV